MGDMISFDVVNRTTSINVHGDPLLPDDLVYFPDGWRSILFILHGSAMLLDGKIKRLYYKKGTMQAEIISNTVGITTTQLKWLIQGFTRETSTTCMVCGNFGRRRKEYSHFPTLCHTHYVEYANEEDQYSALHDGDHKEVITPLKELKNGKEG